MRNALFYLLFLPLFIVSCASPEPKASEKKSEPLVQPEYRLQEDRKAFDEIRAQVPEERKLVNDELSFLDNLFENPLEKPNTIRDKFYKMVSKKRDRFSKDMTKKREAFVKQERKDREQFTKDLEKEREAFRKRKASAEERKEFYSQLDEKRKNFYSEQREKRDDFESQVRDDRKNFEDYNRDKTNEFMARHREFSAKQKDILNGKPAGQ